MLLALLGLGIIAWAKTNTAASALPPSLLEVLPSGSIDLGSIKQGETKEIEFCVRNNSDTESMKIQIVPQSSCSCLKIKTAKEVTLAPTQETTVHLTYAPTYEHGIVSKRVFVIGSLPASHLPISAIVISGDVESEFQMSNLAINLPYNVSSETVQIKDGFSDKVKITAAESLNQGISTHVAADQKSVAISVDRNQLLDRFANKGREIRITTNSSITPLIRIGVYVEQEND